MKRLENDLQKIQSGADKITERLEACKQEVDSFYKVIGVTNGAW